MYEEKNTWNESGISEIKQTPVKKKGRGRKIFTILFSMLAGAAIALGGIYFSLGLKNYSPTEILRLLGALRFIEVNYVDGIDDKKLVDGAIDGMVKSLGDPHSVYMDEDMYKKLKQHNEGTFGGIGVLMSFSDPNKVEILDVNEGSPGEKAGLQKGDIIIAVNGEPTEGRPSEDVATSIRGEKGTEVTLTIRREGEEDRDYVITRDTIQMKTAAGQMAPDNIGYIRIASFGEHTADEFKAAYQKLKDEGMKGLIIDLRANPGGLLNTCVDIANIVVPKGEIVSVVDRSGRKEVYDSTLEAQEYPIVVLIDGNSASASEILAGALQDRGAATLVGDKSYGKGSVQVVLPMLQGDAMKLTIAKYYTPSGRSIDGIGIEPDVKVQLDTSGQYDNQLQKAIDLMKEKMDS